MPTPVDMPRNAIEAVTCPDPHAYYRSLRQKLPLFFDETLGVWVASSHAVVSQAFALLPLRVRPPAEPVPKALLGAAAGEVFALLVRMTDGGFHAANKPAVEQAARRWTLADVARASEQAAGDLLAQPGGSNAPFPVNAFLSALPVRAMARLLDVPAEALDDTVRWVLQFTLGIAPGASSEAVQHAHTGAAALMAQGDALGLQPAQAANRIAFMQQSLDATAGLLGHTVLMLTQQPALAAQADASPDAMRRFVAEVERYCAPVQNTRRFAAGPVTLADLAIEAGQSIVLVLASANRDEALNPQPDKFDPQRAERRSMGFGSGRHACPGSTIAIEIVATCARWMRARGQFDSYFALQTGFRPLANARVPVFED